MKMTMWCLSIRIKRNDELHGKRLEKLLIEFLMGAKVSGATVWTGVDGFDKRGRSTVYMEGILRYANGYRNNRREIKTRAIAYTN
ncbi:MAG: DUF190 domain-containing protein [Nitrososphaeraceae archaeon]